MTETAEQIELLEEDANFAKPLRRVAYEAGMLLGLEATQEEQSYHRRRLNRQQYWLHGSGTLTGMVVAIDPASSGSPDPILTRMTISPGLGVDGLGREVLVNETYCIDLGDWLKAQTESSLRDAYDEVANVLWLKTTVRYQDCEVAKQPVLARKVNLSTDAVQPSRLADSISLEFIPEPPPADDSRFKPWSNHEAIEDAAPASLTQTETDYLAATALSDPALANQLQFHARLLHGLDGSDVDAALAADQLEDGARLLLARISIDVPDINTILNADENDQVDNPNDIHVNNLVRPFLSTPSQLAYLLRNTAP